jgi:SAM-dependent methyltransferase
MLWFVNKIKQPIKRILNTVPHHSVYKDLSDSTGEQPELLCLIKKLRNDAVILNIGSIGKDLRSLHPGIINCDITHNLNIDLFGDATQLPLRDESMDMIIFKNVLEHIKGPQLALDEIERVLKKGAYFYVKIPFLQPFHAVPDDYQRYTENGIKELFKGYQQLDFAVSVGPGSMMSWLLREYLAILTSFGNHKLYRIGIFIWGWLTFWVKYSDLLLRKNQMSSRIASAFYGIYQKV